MRSLRDYVLLHSGDTGRARAAGCDRYETDVVTVTKLPRAGAVTGEETPVAGAGSTPLVCPRRRLRPCLLG
jgi:hypothetical protein